MLELLTVMAIIAILCMISAPSLRTLIERNYFVMTQNNVLQALQYTKLMAIQQGAVFFLCGSSDGYRCDGNWEHHWLTVELSTHKIWRLFSGKTYHTKVTWRGNFSKREGIYFDRFGETGGQRGRFVVQSSREKAEIILIASGRLRNG